MPQAHDHALSLCCDVRECRFTGIFRQVYKAETAVTVAGNNCEIDSYKRMYIKH